MPPHTAPRPRAWLNVLAAGIDTIIHGVHKEADGSDVYRPEITEKIAEQGVYVNPNVGRGRNPHPNAGERL